MKKIIIIILLATASHAFSQDWPVKKMVMERKGKKGSFLQLPAFRFSANKVLTDRGTYQELTLNASFNRQIMEQKPDALKLVIPFGNKESITCELVKYDLGNIKFTENNDGVIEGIHIPVTYRGIISGEQQKNNVVCTINENYLSLVITSNDRFIQIAQVDSTNLLTYRLYNSQQVQFPAISPYCSTKEDGLSQTHGGIRLDGTFNRTYSLQDKCVNVFVDCFDSLYLHFGNNRQQTVDYVYELFNLVATGYINDTINIQVMGVNVWTTTDPYRQDSSGIALNDLGTYYKDVFWGNICVGLDFSTLNKGRGGLAWLSKVKANAPNACPIYNAADSSGAFSYCDLNFNGNLNGFPTGPHTTQGQLEVTMHEIGHQLGSHHTHWCGWQLAPGIIGAIDSCAKVENGPCMTVGTTPPTAGGTIMSYCHLLTGSSIPYNNGFGTLPGNAIRNFVNNTPCIASCLACLIQNKSRTESDWAVHNKTSTAAPKNESPPPVSVPILNPDSKEMYLKRTAATTIQLNR